MAENKAAQLHCISVIGIQGVLNQKSSFMCWLTGSPPVMSQQGKYSIKQATTSVSLVIM